MKKNKTILWLLAAVAVCGLAAAVKVSELPSASSVSLTDVLPMVVGNQTKKATVGQLRDAMLAATNDVYARDGIFSGVVIASGATNESRRFYYTTGFAFPGDLSNDSPIWSYNAPHQFTNAETAWMSTKLFEASGHWAIQAGADQVIAWTNNAANAEDGSWFLTDEGAAAGASEPGTVLMFQIGMVSGEVIKADVVGRFIGDGSRVENVNVAYAEAAYVSYVLWDSGDVALADGENGVFTLYDAVTGVTPVMTVDRTTSTLTVSNVVANGGGLVFTNAAGSAFTLIVNAGTNGLEFIPR